MQTPADCVSSVLSSFARSSGSRLRLRGMGDIPPEVVRSVLISGAASGIWRTDDPADVALVGWDGSADLREIAWENPQALVLWDTREVAPVEARRALLRAWPAVQFWVLPLEGPDACRWGVASAGASAHADVDRVSFTMPVCNEAEDVERVLASFYPVASEIVIGVDAKSTDATEEIARRYADEVFRFDIDPWSFAAARNACMDRCHEPWIFMSEGHEHLDPVSVGPLRTLSVTRDDIGAINVERDIGGEEGGGESFYFQWVTRNHPTLRYRDTHGVHNFVHLDAWVEHRKRADPSEREVLAIGFIPPQIGNLRTIHKAHHANRVARFHQRETMNAEALDAHADEGADHVERSLFYSGQEHASRGDVRTAVRRYLRYVRAEIKGRGFHEQLYEALLRLGEWLIALEKPRQAIPFLKAALPIDLKRNEALVALGDAYKLSGDLVMARHVFEKAAGCSMPHFGHMFRRKAYYRHIPWLGLMYAAWEQKDGDTALEAARRVLSYEPGDTMAQRVIASLGA